MKRILIISFFALIGVFLAGFAVAMARPQWVPAWARINSEKLPHWAHFGSQTPAAEDMGVYCCKEHGVPEKFCTLCHRELQDKLMLCKEHGNIPEDICTLCHSEVAKKYNIEMCPKGHGLPKHFCIKCGTTPTASADLPVPDVRLASAEMASDIGIETAPVMRQRLIPRLTANAEAAYDARRYAEVRPRVSGFLREVHADLGQAIHKGDVLAVADSAEVGTAKARYLTAQAAVKLAQDTYERTRSLARSGSLASRTELEAQTASNEAQANLMEAEQKLRNLRFDDEDLARIARSKDTKGLLHVVAPIDGTIVALEAVVGEAVEPTTQNFAIADTTKMWLWIDVYESDIASVATGQLVTFSISGTPDTDAATFAGKVTWVGTEVDSTTRTTRVRAELDNPQGRLRAHQFGRAVIQVGPEYEAVVVPKEAVQRRNRENLVFIPQSDGVYRPQRVVIRPTDRRDCVEVASGLRPGERIVTTGAFLLKTETMKDALGAGCTDD
ncbi:MAG: efflux RND transporter periplasmic adaptor subunit [Planctomycetaceae bacterium]|nr:efflux RND transporter periplasmic adaptor subunit [Planctomycetaceae bacterium]